MEAFKVPRTWEGCTVAVLASGPSMSQAVADQVRAAGIPAIVVNATFRLAPWADILYAADAPWWNHAENRDAHQFAGLKVSVEQVKGVYQLKYTGSDGFDPNPQCLRTGRNSGYQAVHLAAHAGAARILLCGFDMHGGHWHGDHPPGLKKTEPEHFPIFMAAFPSLGAALRERNVEIINCTPGSALTCFPMADLADVLETSDASD